MPELPEVETIKRIVCPQLAGRTIETTEVRNAQVIAYPESKCFSKALSGQIISNMSRRGKFLTIQLENGDKLSLHLRMTGQLTVVPESEPVEKHTHLIFHLSGGSQLRYIDTHRFGRFWLLRKGEADTVTGQNKLGLEPTDPAITGEYLKTLLGKRKKTVKEMLLDQAVIAGIGNIYSDEILFAAKIYPGTACRILNEYDWDKLAKKIPEIIIWGIESNNMTPEEYLRGKGKEYRNISQLRIYGRAGKPCVRCGTIIDKVTICGRTSCYCPSCQNPRS
jgi:DNA-formamidopyrimidine glycosylase